MDYWISFKFGIKIPGELHLQASSEAAGRLDSEVTVTDPGMYGAIERGEGREILERNGCEMENDRKMMGFVWIWWEYRPNNIKQVILSSFSLWKSPELVVYHTPIYEIIK